MRDLRVSLPTRKVLLPRWALSVLVINAIVSCRDVMLPVGMALFALLFNIAQGKLIEGLLVGLFAFCVMVFLMQSAMVRRMAESNELQQFVDTQIRISHVGRTLRKALAARKTYRG